MNNDRAAVALTQQRPARVRHFRTWQQADDVYLRVGRQLLGQTHVRTADDQCKAGG